MARKYREERISPKEKAKSDYALSFLGFLGLLIFSCFLSVYLYVENSHRYVNTTATIVELVDWKFTTKVGSPNTYDNGRFWYHYYLCEFIDEEGNKRTGSFITRQNIELKPKGEYEDYVKYQSGDTFLATYQPEDFKDGDNICMYAPENNTDTIVLVIFWGSTIISFFMMLSYKKRI